MTSETPKTGSVPAEERYQDHVSRVARGAGMGSVGEVVSRLVGLATVFALARMYGAALLGIYVMGITTVLIANILAQIGMDNGVVRYVARYRAEGDTWRVRGIILLALWTAFALSMLLSGAMFFGSGLLARGLFDKALLEEPLRIFALSLPFFTVMSMAIWAIQGFQTVKYPTYVRYIFQPLLNLVLIATFYVLSAGILGAAVAYCLSMAAGSILGVYYLRRVFPKLLDRATPAKYEPRALFEASAPMIVVNVNQYINTWTTTYILAIFATAADVGIFNVAARTAALTSLTLLAFNRIFSPMVSSIHTRGSSERLAMLYKDVSRWTFIGGLATFWPTVLLAEDILRVFEKAFTAGWLAMILISGAYLFSSSVGLAGRVLAMTGYQKVVMFATVGSTVAGVAAGFALIPAYGLMGAAVATAAAIAVSNGTTVLSVRRLHGFWPYNREYLKPVTAGNLAAATVLLGKLVVPGGLLSLVLLGPLFLLVFAALLIALGLSPSDRQFLKTLLSPVRPLLRRVLLAFLRFRARMNRRA